RQSGRACLYLIDDFASELDSERRNLLAQRLNATGAQVVMSAISGQQVRDVMDGSGTMFRVEQGEIHPA
ncbi:MAG: DNA replication/repair protein RecF, partial [Enterobacteriaceae bacterium]